MHTGLTTHDYGSFGLDFYAPVFSSDDKTLYFVSSWPDVEHGWPLGTIYRVAVQDLLYGSTHLNIHAVSPENELSGFPALSSDGRWLLYSVKTGEAIDVWLQAVDGTSRQRLVGDGFKSIWPSWRPAIR
jgi:Tol biopolymer transport system component